MSTSRIPGSTPTDPPVQTASPARLKLGYACLPDTGSGRQELLEQVRHALLSAGAERALVEAEPRSGPGAGPLFRQLRDLIRSGQVRAVITPSQERLSVHLELVLDLAQLCRLHGVALLNLEGETLAVRGADGRVISQLLETLEAHRSELYGEKTRRHLQVARDEGYPARPRVPYGLRKVRDEKGRFVEIELHPRQAPLARQRIHWFLRDGLSVAALARRIEEQHRLSVQAVQLGRWLRNPMLTGRRCWHKNDAGVFAQVEEHPSFPALISDAEHQAILQRLNRGRSDRGLRGRTRRMFTGLCRCSNCDRGLVYKVSGSSTTYLRCLNARCERKGKAIRADQVEAVLAWSLAMQGEALLLQMQQTSCEAPQIAMLEQEIAVLQTIGGTERVVEQKRHELERWRSGAAELPAWLLIGCLRSERFWDQEESQLNRQLSLLLEGIVVELGDSTAESQLQAVQCRTLPAAAPLPPNQRRLSAIPDPRRQPLSEREQQRMEEALASLWRESEPEPAPAIAAQHEHAEPISPTPISPTPGSEAPISPSPTDA